MEAIKKEICRQTQAPAFHENEKYDQRSSSHSTYVMFRGRRREKITLSSSSVHRKLWEAMFYYCQNMQNIRKTGVPLRFSYAGKPGRLVLKGRSNIPGLEACKNGLRRHNYSSKKKKPLLLLPVSRSFF